MMASHIRSTVHFATPRVQFLFVNPGHKNTERSVDVLHRSGKFWLQSYGKFSLNMTPKVHTLSRPLISVPKCSTCSIAGVRPRITPVRLSAVSPLGESSFFFLCGALVLWSLQEAIYLCKRQIPNDHMPLLRKTNQSQCNRPYDTATCYLHTDIWQSIHVDTS